MNEKWKGERITETLIISPSPTTPDRWFIHELDRRGIGVGTREDMLKLARVILENLGEEPKTGDSPRTYQLDWLRQYRRQNQKATLRDAMAAWQEHLETTQREEEKTAA